MEWYLMAWRKFAQFDGRSRRKEYWMFTLFNCVAVLALGAIAMAAAAILASRSTDASGDSSPLLFTLMFIPIGIYGLAITIPSLAVATRRFHDIGKSGWLLFLLIALGVIPTLAAHRAETPVAFGAGDGRRNGLDDLPAERAHAIRHFIDRQLVRGGSRTMPPLPTCSRPASNCGLTRITASLQRRRGGQYRPQEASVAEMNETSMTRRVFSSFFLALSAIPAPAGARWCAPADARADRCAASYRSDRSRYRRRSRARRRAAAGNR
jgi:uncharacterized membrane protein YhaH (DUF805 family)